MQEKKERERERERERGRGQHLATDKGKEEVGQ